MSQNAPAPVSQSSRSKAPVWRRDETIAFIEVWGQNHFQSVLGAAYRNIETFESIAVIMQHRGFRRTPEQLRAKAKALRAQYKAVKQHNSKSGNDRMDWEFEELLDKFLRVDGEVVVPIICGNNVLRTGGRGRKNNGETNSSQLSSNVQDSSQILFSADEDQEEVDADSLSSVVNCVSDFDTNTQDWVLDIIENPAANNEAGNTLACYNGTDSETPSGSGMQEGQRRTAASRMQDLRRRRVRGRTALARELTSQSKAAVTEMASTLQQTMETTLHQYSSQNKALLDLLSKHHEDNLRCKEGYQHALDRIASSLSALADKVCSTACPVGPSAAVRALPPCPESPTRSRVSNKENDPPPTDCAVNGEPQSSPPHPKERSVPRKARTRREILPRKPYSP